jgi:thiamine-phosphate pyrophosphorylase
MGEGAIIGVSCYDQLNRARKAESVGADYVAFGSFFPSKTKPNTVRATTDLLREARQLISIPIVAIGGITPENGKMLLDSGADLLAVIQGLFGEPNPEDAAKRYSMLFEYMTPKG